LRYDPSISRYEGRLKFFKGFFCIYWDDHVILALESIYVLYYIYWFVCAKLSLHAWSESNFLMVYFLFNVLFSLVCKHFIEDFCMCVHQVIDLVFLFCYTCMRFQYLSNCDFIEYVWKHSFPSYFMDWLEAHLGEIVFKVW
jgi:hypothetical protein